MKKLSVLFFLSLCFLPHFLLAQTETTFRITASISGSGSVLPTGGNNVFYDYADGSGRYKINELQMIGLSSGSFASIQIRVMNTAAGAAGMTKLEFLSVYMPQPCASDIVSVSIDPNASVDDFYDIEFVCAENRGPCSRLEYDGDDLAAGALVYFDNGSGVFSGDVYMSVASPQNAIVADFSGSYSAGSDTWYKMDDIGNGLYMATVNAPATAARISFWNGDYSTGVKDGAVVFFNIPYDAENPKFVPSATNNYTDTDEWCAADGLDNSYYTVLGSWREGPPSATVSSTRTYIDASYDESFTLSVTLSSGTAVSYQWQRRLDSENGFSDISGATTNPYEVMNGQFPSETAYYRCLITLADGTVVTSGTVTVTVAASCGGNTEPVVVYRQDFGTVPAEYNGYNGDGMRFKYREPLEGMVGYEYKPYPVQINDGHYAVVADPYYGGCDGNDVEACIPAVRTIDESISWYRDYFYPYSSSNAIKFRDHTVNQQDDDAEEFGLCLMINYSVNGETLAYEHELTDSEKENMTPGSVVRLTAYVASAARYQAGTTIMESVTMTIELQFRSTEAGAQWATLVSQETTVKHHDNWLPIVTPEFELGHDAGDYRLRIYSSGEGGKGNDVLIDDIRLEVCRPKLRLYFEDEEGKTSSKKIMEKAAETVSLLVPHFDEAALGESPCVMLFLYGQNGYEAYLGDFTVSQNGSGENEYRMNLPDTYTDADDNVVKLVSSVPGAWSFAAIATTDAICSDSGLKKQLIEDVIGGNVDPSTADDCVGSNIVDLITECATAPQLSTDAETSLCLDDPADFVYPVLKLAFDYFSDENIAYTLYQDGNIVNGAENISLAAALQTGEVEINLADYAAALAWQPGSSHSLYVEINETYEGTQICPRSSNEITFSIGITPQINGVLQDVDFCRGEQASVTANVSNATELLWQQSTDGGVTWNAAEGENNTATYMFPERTASGTQYKLIATNRAGNLVCGPVESNVITATVSNAVAPAVTDYNECAVEGVKQLSDLASGYEGVLQWYDADMNLLADATFSTSEVGEYTYYVRAVDGNCQSEDVPVNVTIRSSVSGIDLLPAEETDITIGTVVDKTLSVNPADAVYTVVWTVNGNQVQVQGNILTETPYTDRLYKVVVTDECGNSFEASATATVAWPTIITPHLKDDKNDDFLVGLQEDIYLEIYDRWGNKIFSGNNGWPQSEAARQMPGIYYYTATMPDGTVKKGTVEIYK